MNDQWTNEQVVVEHLLHLKQCAWFYGQYKVWNNISTLRVYLAEKEAIKQCLFYYTGTMSKLPEATETKKN